MHNYVGKYFLKKKKKKKQETLTICFESGLSNDECGVKGRFEQMVTFLGIVNLGKTDDAAAAAATDKPAEAHNCG